MARPGVITTSDPAAVKLWALQLEKDITDNDPFAPYTGEGANSIIRIRRDLEKGAGDLVRFSMKNMLTGPGFMDEEDAEGTSENLTLRNDELYIHSFGHSVKWEGRMVDQRSGFRMRVEAKDSLAEWCVQRKAQATALHLCGITGEFKDYASDVTLNVSDTKYTMGNATRAPASGRQIWAGGQTTDQGLTSSHLFDLSLIDKALDIIKVSRPRIQGPYTCFVHPYQSGQLISTAGSRWEKIQLAAISAQNQKSLPLYRDAIGIYRDVVFVETPYMPCGINSSTGAVITTTRRAVLCGRQALTVSNGKDSGGGSFWNWAEEVYDIGRKWRCSVECVSGMVKTQYKLNTDATNKTDYGTIVISTYGG